MHNQRSQGSALVLSVIVATITGCAGFNHGYTTLEYAKRCISLQTEPGKKRLEIEMAFDLTVRGFVEDHGTPDFLYVVDNSTLHVFYVGQDFAATFSRPTMNAYSKVTKFEPIELSLLALLPTSDREALIHQRGSASHRIDEDDLHVAPGARPQVERLDLDTCIRKCEEFTTRTRDACFDRCAGIRD